MIEFPASPIDIERTRILYRNAPIGVIASCATGYVAAAAMAYDDASIVAIATLWGSLLFGCMMFHLGLCLAFWRAVQPDPERWARLFIIAAFFEGLVWGAGVIVFADPVHYYRNWIMLTLSAGIVASTSSVFTADLRPFKAFAYPAMVPHVIVQLIQPYPLHLLAATLASGFLIAVGVATGRANTQTNEVLRLRFDNEALAQDLATQRDRAQGASVAKSAFLAAASHDLRQPIHALGMFVGALRSRRMDRTGRALVDHIGESVGAMDDLFAALLDISKLDAGAVAPHIEPVAVQPLLERLARDYAVEASAKAVQLRLVTSTAIVASDAVLLERILRNLISNAVRYTDHGRILIGCRSSHARLSFEIWDTGCGIDATEQTRIFDEFYQVGNRERDRTRGLGLGLAIVRRLAVLIDGTISLRSQPGVGSVFRLDLPRLPASGRAELPAPPAIVQPGSGAHILVIDDELQVQRATAALLTSWGYVVTVAGATAEALERTRAAPPALIISDYRLRDASTGIDAIHALRASHGRLIPAMLVTGDTAPGRIAEAQASGFLLLHKPLANAKLRAAIGNMLRVTPS